MSLTIYQGGISQGRKRRKRPGKETASEGSGRGKLVRGTEMLLDSQGGTIHGAQSRYSSDVGG